MSLYARLRKKRRRKFKVFLKKAERIDEFLVFQIHEIPNQIEYGQEFDFWILDRKDRYLLRIEKSKENMVYFTRSTFADPLYCIMKVDFESIDVEKYLKILKRIGIPYRKKSRSKRKITNEIG